MQRSFESRIATRQGHHGASPRAVVGRIAAAVALVALALTGRPAVSAPAQVPAQAPTQQPSWVLDRFSVTFFDYGQSSRNEVRDRAGRSFGFGGEYNGPGGNTYRANGMLTVSVPDRIESGGVYSADARATGDISIAGTIPADGEIAFTEVRSLCWGGDEEGRVRDEKRLLPAAPSASLSAVVPPMTFTAPVIVGPTTPPSHNCEFQATLHVGFVTEWRVWVQAQYKPTLPTEPFLSLDANPARLPPTGVTPSESVLTATLRDAAGRPIAGQRIELRLEPADMGRLQAASGTTDAGGSVRLRYTAPKLAELRGRTSVVVRALAPGRGLERTLSIEIASYRLAVTIDPDRLLVTDPPGSAKLRIVAERFDGRPAADDIIELTLDPPDMGRLLGDRLLENRVVTDAQGVAELFYEAPPVAAMQNRDLVTIFARNISHGGEAAAAIRFLGLRVTGTQPPEGVRDVDLKPGGGSVISFDRAIDPASVDSRTVRVQTLWHGDLAAQAEVAGSTLQVRVTQDPIPDIGLVITVRLAGGADGIRGVDGSLLPGDFTLRFMTMPRLSPRITVSQVVDDPRDPVHGVISVAPKPFVLRVSGGLSGDSELTEELATVKLTHPAGGAQTLDHTFYPGDWPPRVPDAAVRRGNSANFTIRSVPPAGAFPVTAEVRPFFAPDDKAVAASPVTVNINRWSNPRVALGLGVLFVPLQNDHLPGYEWKVSRNQQNRWASHLGVDAVRYLPLSSLSMRMGYFMDTTCNDPDECDFARRPWTEFNYWARHVGRAGYATPWSYVVGVVPPGWFAARFAEHPDVLANPQLYHNMVNNGIWSDASIARDFLRSSPAESAIIEADASDAAFVHALGDVRGLRHTDPTRGELAGYDLLDDRAIVSNAEGWTGAHLSLMSEDVGYGSEWMTRADYMSLLDWWTQKSCEGMPPCPPSSPVANRVPTQAAARASTSVEANAVSDASGGTETDAEGKSRVDADVNTDPLPLIGISGTIREGASETAKIEPLIWFDGRPTLAAGGTGDYAIVLRDAAGGILGRYAFTPVFGPVDGGRLASFLFAVPRPAGLSAVVLAHGSAEIGALRRTANSPVVTITRPAGGRNYRGSIDVGWAGQDADGDRLSYHLLFSGDGGQTWLPLLVDSSRTAYTLTGDELPNGPDTRLRVVASDGFNSGQAEIDFSMDGTQRVLATVPEDGARGLSPNISVSAIFRDPLDPATVSARTFVLRDLLGNLVPGAVAYQALDDSIRFEPALPLAEARGYEARLTTGVLTMDGRALPVDHVWRFTTRGKTVYLPQLQQSGNTRPQLNPPSPTIGPPPATTPGPTRTTPTPTPTRSRSTVPPPTRTGAATLTPTATDQPTSPPTPSPTPPPPVGSLTATIALTTGSDPNRRRQAFAPGEPIQLWVGVTNDTGAPVTAEIEFVVVGDNGFAPDELAWRGPLEVVAGANWFRLERTLAAGTPAGPYLLLGTVEFSGRSSTATADFFVAAAVQRADDFGDPRSGWTSQDDANVHSGYLAGAFQILVKTADYWRFDTPNVSATDFAMEVDASFVGDADGAAGLVSGVSADGQSFLVFVILRDGRFGLVRRNAGAWETVLPFAASGSIDRNTNHLMLTRQGAELRLYANGRQLAVVSEGSVAGGRVALFAQAIAAGLDARFDDFRLYRVR